jgi:hypothetical protein
VVDKMSKKKEKKEDKDTQVPKFKPQFGGSGSRFGQTKDIEPTQNAGAISNPNTFKTQHKG